MITKVDAARRQLDRAILLLDEDDLPAHALAYNAYCLLRDLFGSGEWMTALKKIEDALDLRPIAEYLKHGETHPEAVLKRHSAETVHAVIKLAIRLWQEHGYEPTQPMKNFSTRANPYEEGKLHHKAVEIIDSGELNEVTKLTQPSTAKSAIEHGPRRKGR